MKVALVVPRAANMTILPNLGLGYLAGMMREKGFEFELFHCGKEKLKTRELVGILGAGRFDIIGIQSLSYYHNIAVDISKGIKSLAPSSIVVIGGPHSSGVRETVLAEDASFDFGFAGEAEIGFTKFVEQIDGANLSPEDIPGLIWRDGRKCIANENMVVNSLDSLPMPPWDKMNPRNFPHQAHGMFPPGFPVLPVIFSRGCNYNCAFCAGRTISGPGIRYRSVENIMDEIKYIYSELNIRTIAFLDQNLTADRNSIMNLCHAIIDSNMKLNWYCPNGVHLNSLDDDILEIMKVAGCASMTVGIESASTESLRALNRTISSDSLSDTINMVKKHGMKITGNFIIGLPNETLRDFKNTVFTSLDLKLDRAQFAFFVPFPGTPLFYEFFPSPEPGNIDWTAFDITLPVFVKNVSIFTSWLVMLSAFLFFYIRPGIMYNNIRDIKSINHQFFILSRILNIPLNMMKWRFYRIKRMLRGITGPGRRL